MREGARRNGDKLVSDPDICLNDLGIHMQLGHPDMLRLDAYADSPPSLVDKTDRKPFGEEFFQVMGQMPPEAKDCFE